MGCDIHLHVEIKVEGRWHHYNHVSVPRDYELFGLMAGVRGGNALVEPRGLPRDATRLTRADYEQWLDDHHTASWLNPDEVHAICRAHFESRWGDAKSFGYLLGDSYSGFIDYPEDRPPFVEDFRFVFWFDN